MRAIAVLRRFSNFLGLQVNFIYLLSIKIMFDDIPKIMYQLCLLHFYLQRDHSGRGLCMSMRDLAEQATNNQGSPVPILYGSEPHSSTTWDADMV